MCTLIKLVIGYYVTRDVVFVSILFYVVVFCVLNVLYNKQKEHCNNNLKKKLSIFKVDFGEVNNTIADSFASINESKIKHMQLLS